MLDFDDASVTGFSKATRGIDRVQFAFLGNSGRSALRKKMTPQSKSSTAAVIPPAAASASKSASSYFSAYRRKRGLTSTQFTQQPEAGLTSLLGG